MRRSILILLVLAACTGGERSNPPTRQTTASAPRRGPDALMLRIPRVGGTARVVAYTSLDSVMWTSNDASPALSRVLAFDADAGVIAASGTRDEALWIDLNVGSATVAGKGKLRGLTSIDGSTIYGVGADGAIARFTPAGNSVLKAPQPARDVFPQTTQTLLVFGGRGDGTRVWRLRIPDGKVLDSVNVAGATTGVGAPLGDRVYFVVDGRKLVGVRPKTLTVGNAIAFDHRIESVTATPSGDRFYVVADSENAVHVVDRYQDRETVKTDLPGRPRDLRVDPFGRYLLVRGSADSVWIVAVGSEKVVATVQSQWRGDLPFVAPDGAIAVTNGRDVSFLNLADARAVRTVAGGADDFWYPFVWNGLRRTDTLVTRPTLHADSDTARAAVPHDTVPAPPPVDSARLGFTVSFAALLNGSTARDQAAKVVVNGQTARVVTAMVDGTAVYRIVLGPYATRAQADSVGHASGQSYVVYAGTP